MVKILSAIFLSCIFAIANTSVFKCPELPLIAGFGEVVKDDWIILYQGENVSSLEYFYLKLTSDKYQIMNWDFLGIEPILEHEKLKFTAILCCKILKNKTICATKKIDKQNCSVIKKPYSYSFRCDV